MPAAAIYALLALLTTAIPLTAQSSGPQKGTLIVIGGGEIGPEIAARFAARAGCPGALVVAIPTAGEADSYPVDWKGADFLRRAGCPHISVLHTRDRAVADSEEFVAPLRRARGVFFGGGRQWRLVDSYMGTRTQREIETLLARGGVVGGSSAGASIQASFLVRGAREDNRIMEAPGYLRGFGYLRNVAVDQHLLTRNRQDDLVPVIDRHPELLGIGIDEATAIVVDGNRFEVVGASKVAIYDHGRRRESGETGYYFLEPGARFDISRRALVAE